MVKRVPRRPICLVYYCPILKVYKLVPLKTIQYEVEIRGPLALVRLTQQYLNNSTAPINVSYEFPRSEDSCFTRFEAKFEDRVVLGQIKPKDEARAEFQAHKAIGSTVAYAEMKDNDEDIMKIDLGNFPPGQNLSITFCYVEPLDLIATQFWKFVIPSALTPRYKMAEFANQPQAPNMTGGNTNMAFAGKFGGAMIGGALMQATPAIGIVPSKYPVYGGIEYVVEAPYTWNVSVSIYQHSGDATLFCATHKNEVSISKGVEGALHKTTVQFMPGQHYPNKDFEIMFSDKSFHLPSVELMTKTDLTDPTLPSRCAMMHFVPQLAGYARFDAEGREIPDEAEEISHYMDTVKSEYVFIIDRSGSMDGERINIAKKALQLALRSLPYDSYFNIVSFGSSFSFLHPVAVQANQVTIDQALAKVNQFKADMGGTEILAPLNACFHAPVIQNYQRTIFLLTDGDVSNAVDVINKTREFCTFNRSRVFTVGIGNGVSSQFIKGVADAGNGASDIIHNLTIIEDKY